MAHSPWGLIQHTTKLTPGVTFVSTASHGGIRVSPTAAKRMSAEARALGIRYSGNLWYEEDEMACVVGIELGGFGELNQFISSLSFRHADYLRSQGLTPDAVQEKRGQMARERDARRAANDPDLIVAARNDGEGRVLLWLANGKTTFADAETYRQVYATAPYPLLSLVRDAEANRQETQASA